MSHIEDNRVSLWKKDFILLCFFSLLSFTVTQIANSTTSLFVDALGGSATYSGFMMFAYTAAALIVRMLCGKWIDRLGCRVFILSGAVSMAVSIACYNFFPILPALGVWRFLQGVSFSMISTAAGVAVANALHPSLLGKGISVFSLAHSCATTIGPYLGLALIMGDRFHAVYWTAAAISLVSVVLAMNCSFRVNAQTALLQKAARPAPEAPPRGDAPAPARKAGRKGLLGAYFERAAVNPAVIQLIVCVSVSSIIFFLPLFAVDKPYADAGLFFVVASLAMIASRLLVVRIIDSVSIAVILVPCMLGGVVCMLCVAFIANTPVFLAAACLYGCLHGICQPTLNTVVMSEAPIHRRGVAMATFFLFVDSGMGAGALLWGRLIDLFGFTIVYCIGAALLLFNTPLLLLLRVGRSEAEA
ncbi:MAG: MFS transporter [Clostridiales Family XIII bacterium]|nr:MFS transporter [Clostridiales Family XIII bacterium]